MVSLVGAMIIGAISAGAIWAVAAHLYSKDHPNASGFFSGVYPKYASRLGSPLADPEPSGGAYQAAHEHATVVWIARTLTFYLLPSDPSKKWLRQPDTDWQAAPEWYNDNALRHRFGTPAELGPPFAGVANRWSHDPDNWKWIGWRQWHCSFDSGQIVVQRFERGMVIGPFRLHPLNKSAQVFILMDDGSWFPELASGDAPACVAPVQAVSAAGSQ